MMHPIKNVEGVLSISVILLAGMTLPGQHFANAAAPTSLTADNVTLSKHPVILVVSYDGFKRDYFGKVPTPALDALKASGVRVSYMEPVFPTVTFTNHQSVATGLYSETHGIVDNEFYDPVYNKTLSGFSDDPGFWNYNPEVLPIWLRNEMAGDGRKSGCLMWAGSSQGYGPNNDSLPTYYYPGYNGSVPWEERVDTVISWMTNSSAPANLVFLYYNEPDSRGHAFGPNAPETLEEIRTADNRTAYLVNKLTEVGIFDKINLILLSDHGMEAVTPMRVSNVSELFQANSELIERVEGITPVLQITAKEGKVEELFDNLSRNVSSHNYSIWRKEGLREPHFYSNSRRVMDLVMIAEPGHAFDDFTAFIERYNERYNFTPSPTREYGVHGYTNTLYSMMPFFLAHGPAFLENHDHAVIKNVDVVPLISAILGIPEPPHNGSLARVEGMIKPPSGGSDNLSTTGWTLLFGVALPIAMSRIRSLGYA